MSYVMQAAWSFSIVVQDNHPQIPYSQENIHTVLLYFVLPWFTVAPFTNMD